VKRPPSPRHLLAWHEWAVLGSGLALFGILAGQQLHLPGPHYDEAIEVLPAVQLLLGQPVEAFRGAGIHFAGRLWPLMVMDYIGAVNTYLSIPFFALFGINVPAMRLLSLSYAAGALVFLYLLARELWGRAAGAIALGTLAASVSFVFWSRQGIFVTNVTSTILVASLWSGIRWWRTGRRRYALLTAFLWGLGLYAKFLFLWGILAAVGAGVLLYGDQIWRRRRELLRAWTPGRAAGLAGAFVVPLLPLIVFNLQTAGTFQTFLHNARTSYYGVNNLAFWNNLAERWKQFIVVLRGEHFWYLGETYADPFWPPALALSLALVLVVMALRGRRAGIPWRRALFPYFMIALIIVQSCFTISALWFTHYALLLPLPALALAGGLSFSAQQAAPRWRGWMWALAGVLAAGLIVSDIQVDLRYHAILARSGGYHAHSDAVYRLAEVLEARADGPVLAMDWGISAPVQFLTLGRVAPREAFGYERLEAPDEGFAERLRPYLTDPRVIYVFHPAGQDVYRGRAEAFNALVAEAGRQAAIVDVIYERSGRPAFVLLQVQ
jgi:hypothetical protein